MKCASCATETSRVRIIGGREVCHKCGGFSEGGGVRTDGILSRQRIRMDSVKYEGDVLNPWAYSKSEKSFVPNDEFIKRHGEHAESFFTADDLQKTHPKLAQKYRTKTGVDMGVTGEGAFEPEATKVMGEV